MVEGIGSGVDVIGGGNCGVVGAGWSCVTPRTLCLGKVVRGMFSPRIIISSSVRGEFVYVLLYSRRAVTLALYASCSSVCDEARALGLGGQVVWYLTLTLRVGFMSSMRAWRAASPVKCPF